MKIEVSDEVFLRLQNLATPLIDTPNDVIRRLLDAVTPTKTGLQNKAVPESLAGTGAMIAKGVVIPEGTRLKADYKGNRYEAEVRGGVLVWNQNCYRSPSAAAVAVIRSTGSTRTTEDGWRFWEYIDQSGEWRLLDTLRRTEYTRGDQDDEDHI